MVKESLTFLLTLDTFSREGKRLVLKDRNPFPVSILSTCKVDLKLSISLKWLFKAPTDSLAMALSGVLHSSLLKVALLLSVGTLSQQRDWLLGIARQVDSKSF